MKHLVAILLTCVCTQTTAQTVATTVGPAVIIDNPPTTPTTSCIVLNEYTIVCQ